MGGGGSQVTGSHAPSSQLPSSVHWRLNARLKGKEKNQHLDLGVLGNFNEVQNSLLIELIPGLILKSKKC